MKKNHTDYASAVVASSPPLVHEIPSLSGIVLLLLHGDAPPHRRKRPRLLTNKAYLKEPEWRELVSIVSRGCGHTHGGSSTVQFSKYVLPAFGMELEGPN